jgi:hypothetical protein
MEATVLVPRLRRGGFRAYVRPENASLEDLSPK